MAGSWGPEHSSSHIDLLVLLAGADALGRVRGAVAGRTVLVLCDSTTVVAYIGRQGGTRSALLCAPTWGLLLGCMRSKVSLTTVHLPDVGYTADTLSRGWICPTEWTLCPHVVLALFRMIARPRVGLFTSANTLQLPLYCVGGPGPAACQRAALAFSVGRALSLCFPPDLTHRPVFTKLVKEDCHVLLFAPGLPCPPWFTRLARLRVHRPVVLPRGRTSFPSPARASCTRHRSTSVCRAGCCHAVTPRSGPFTASCGECGRSPAGFHQALSAGYGTVTSGAGGGPYIPPLLR